jgi:hypothetical protein
LFQLQAQLCVPHEHILFGPEIATGLIHSLIDKIVSKAHAVHSVHDVVQIIGCSHLVAVTIYDITERLRDD